MDLLTLDSLPPDLQTAVSVRDLAAGQCLFEQNDPTSAYFVVETGRIQVARYTSEHQLVTLQIAEAGQSLAEIALFSDTHPCMAIAEVASRVIVYPKQPLLLALRDNADLAEDFMAMLVRKIQSLKVRLELLNIRTAHERVLQYLRYLSQPGEQRVITFDRSLKDIASELGFTPETLSRALARLEREGAITRERQQITLNHPPAA